MSIPGELYSIMMEENYTPRSPKKSRFQPKSLILGSNKTPLFKVKRDFISLYKIKYSLFFD